MKGSLYREPFYFCTPMDWPGLYTEWKPVFTSKQAFLPIPAQTVEN
jgi:hypothetical protein